jgi:predicted transcriptional regulator
MNNNKPQKKLRKDTSITVRISGDFKELLHQIALERDVSMSTVLRQLAEAQANELKETGRTGRK